MWLTRLAELADPKYGLRVVFESGWRTRGASGGAQMKAVQGVLWHHDVAPKSGTYPLRAMLRDGRKGLSGPLCHIGFDRDGVVHVVGAGKANHAGTGKVPGVVRNGGNTRLIGIEMTSTGRGDWTAAQLREMPKLGRALNAIFGLNASQHWSHKEYSDSGKIDPYGLPGGMAGLRDRIRAAYTGGLAGPGGGMSVPRPSAPADDGLSHGLADVDKTQAWLIGLGYNPGPADGKYGAKTEAATRAFQTDFGITPADGRPGPATRKHLEESVTKLDDINKKIDALPARILHQDIPLEGTFKGKSGNLTGLRKWYAHDMAEIKSLIRGSQAAVLKAVQESGKAQGLTDAQIQAIAEAAAAAAARVSADDVAEQLTVTAKGD